MDRYDEPYHDDAHYDGDHISVGPAEGDAIEHLWNAAHELLRAVRTIVDAADEFVASQRAAMNPRVPREYAPALRTWMDQIQRMAGDVEQI